MYQFDEKQHIHTYDGKPLCGVTTVLGIIAKPALIQWSANEAVKYIEQNLPKFEEVIKNPACLQTLFQEAKYAHKMKKDKAGDWGTILHKAIENWIKDGKEPALENEQKIVFDKFKKWSEDKKVKFLESEKHVWSKELWIGGIADMVIEIDGKKYIADIKTSSGIYDEHFFQMGAYNLCLEEMELHKDIEGYIVINLKKDGTIDFKMAVNMDINKRAFLSALELYKIKQSLQ